MRQKLFVLLWLLCLVMALMLTTQFMAVLVWNEKFLNTVYTPLDLFSWLWEYNIKKFFIPH